MDSIRRYDLNNMQKTSLITVLLVFLVFVVCCGQSSKAATKTITPAELETIKKSVEERVYSNVKGNIVTKKEVVDIVKNEVTNQVTTIQASYQKQINSTWYTAIVLICVLGFSLLKDFIRAWRESGSTFRNFIGLI